MAKQIGAIAFIFLCTAIAWAFLGTTVQFRTDNQDTKLCSEVGSLWGTSLEQKAPLAYYPVEEKFRDTKFIDGQPVEVEKTRTKKESLIPDSTKIKGKISLEHRKKGLLWYATYHVVFDGEYVVENTTGEPRDIYFSYLFPNSGGIYDNFVMEIDGKAVRDLLPENGEIIKSMYMQAGEKRRVRIAYGAQGLNDWWYIFGSGVSQLRNFSLVLNTDFDGFDFPERGISPVAKKKTADGWELRWEYTNLISDIQIGLEMPQKINPGPMVGRLSFFAPVSLFLFFFLLFIITTVKNIRLHPMNYFFLATGFFSFHLLLSYLVDHIDIHLAFVICSVVSIFLVISYMRLVVGVKFALFEIGISQLVYLVLFSYAFFLDGYTGLSVTICCILTLFIVMQLTGRMDWGEKFRRVQTNSLQPEKGGV
ncbi:MAG: inner membrane CreD family protein [Candidatus Zixiibacteriota bacterium]